MQIRIFTRLLALKYLHVASCLASYCEPALIDSPPQPKCNFAQPCIPILLCTFARHLIMSTIFQTLIVHYAALVIILL